MKETSRDDNLTGGQIQEVLDATILEAISPIIRSSDVFDLQLVSLLSLTARNRKRKISALPREEFIDTISQALVTPDRAKKIELIARAKIERGFLYNFVVNFLSETQGYTKLYQEYMIATNKLERRRLNLKLTAIESNVGASRQTLFATVNACADFLALTYEFRNRIVEQYVKFAYKQARAFCAQKGETFDFKDVSQNFLAAVTKGVDKYDSSKGALTSYIQYWLLNAHTSNPMHGHEYGIAYTVPQLFKKQAVDGEGSGEVNFSVSLDKIVGDDSDDTSLQDFLVGSGGVDEDIEKQQELDRIRYFAKCSDIRGIARLYLEIEEVFSERELEKMRQTMIKQLGVDPHEDQKQQRLH